VIAPFAYSDGTCDFCAHGLQTSCRTGGYWGGRGDGGQGEAVRAPLADGTLVPLPDEVDLTDDRLAAALATLTDVMGTGHHGALNAGVAPGTTVAVVGDGAVGLCAVLAAKRLGAERIIAMGHHEARLDLARRFGATDVVTERGDEAAARVRELTGGDGPERMIEAVGTSGSFATAFASVRPGGTIGHVGAPAQLVDLLPVHQKNIRLIGGVAPVRGYMEELLADVLDGRLDPSPVLDTVIPLDEVPEGYAAMDERRALKVLVRTGAA
jgi:threonine dehydrogenase-like Zn-dependent dehydrogenase